MSAKTRAMVTIEGVTKEYEAVGRPGCWNWRIPDYREGVVFNWSTEGGTRPTLQHLRAQVAAMSGESVSRDYSRGKTGVVVAKWID